MGAEPRQQYVSKLQAKINEKGLEIAKVEIVAQSFGQAFSNVLPVSVMSRQMGA
jgi:hypothetical protein